MYNLSVNADALPPPLVGEALADRKVFANRHTLIANELSLPRAPLVGKTPPAGGGGTQVPKGERLSSECETERARLFPKSKETQRSKLCLSESVYRCVFLFPLSDSPSQALTRQLFPFLALPFSPDRGKSFPKGEPLAKRGNRFCILCTVLPLQFVKMRQIL